jgi:N-acetylmuramoyl-L-alanine amidase
MIGLLALLAAPPQVVITTPRGETQVPVSVERGTAAVAAPVLAAALNLTVTLDGSEATIGVEQTVFVFELGAPFVRSPHGVRVLLGTPYVVRDTLFLPLDWLSVALPEALRMRYHWDPDGARFAELAPGEAPAAPAPPLAAANPITGLRQPHAVVIDPGHGGADPGNPGVYFPHGVVEKDITLWIAKLLRAELVRRGVSAQLTRTTDTLIDLADRGAACSNDCDLFVSIHVNSMPAGRHQDRSHGVETYFLSDAKTEDQKRVAKMENDALRFETTAGQPNTDVGFILRDLQVNEYLRQSAELAELVETRVAAIHPGGDHGVQQAGFMVLTTARRPAILVETGFATNPADAAFLASSVGAHRIAAAIADGIVAYLLEFERRVAVARPSSGGTQ